MDISTNGLANETVSGTPDGFSDDRPPYTTTFLVEYCKKHWPTWVNQIHQTLVEVQREIDILPMPTLQLSNASRGLEVMLPPMMIVSSASSGLDLLVFQLLWVQIEKSFQNEEIKDFESFSDAVDTHEVRA